MQNIMYPRACPKCGRKINNRCNFLDTKSDVEHTNMKYNALTVQDIF